MSGLLIDTDVFIDYLMGSEQAADFLEYARDDLHLSAITIAELSDAFLGEAEWQALDSALTALQVHAVDVDIARAATGLRGRTFAHRMIAATARTHKLKLVTRDRKAYPDLEDVLVPYRPLL